MSSLYDRLGGQLGVDTVVEIFYMKVRADRRIGHWFTGVDLQRQRKKFNAFVTQAFGGPRKYTERSIARAHSRMVATGLGDKDFDIMVSLLVETLHELKVPQELIDEVSGVVLPPREVVLGRTIDFTGYSHAHHRHTQNASGQSETDPVNHGEGSTQSNSGAGEGPSNSNSAANSSNPHAFANDDMNPDDAENSTSAQGTAVCMIL